MEDVEQVLLATHSGVCSYVVFGCTASVSDTRCCRCARTSCCRSRPWAWGWNSRWKTCRRRPAGRTRPAADGAPFEVIDILVGLLSFQLDITSNGCN